MKGGIVSSCKDYYAGGSIMPGRNFNSNEYRYGFNGKENDPETVGTGQGTQDYGMRIYNPSLGRFLSIDPLAREFPYYTPYQFAGNSPIRYIDLDGAEEMVPPLPQSSTKSIPHKLQGAMDGSGDIYVRAYGINIRDSKLTAKQIFTDVQQNFSDYTVGQSYFEKIKGASDQFKIGDEIAIVGGPDYKTYETKGKGSNDNVMGFYKKSDVEQLPEQIDKNGTFHDGIIKSGVTVIGVESDDVAGKYSFTFQTWEGHPESGTIKFTFQQEKDNNVTLTISSAASNGSFIFNMAYKYGGGMEQQTSHWINFLQNAVKKSDGKGGAPVVVDPKVVEK